MLPAAGNVFKHFGQPSSSFSIAMANQLIRWQLGHFVYSPSLKMPFLMNHS